MKKLLLLVLFLAACESPFSHRSTQNQTNNNQNPTITEEEEDVDFEDENLNECDFRCVDCIGNDRDGISDESCLERARDSEECEETRRAFGGFPNSCFLEVEEEGVE